MVQIWLLKEEKSSKFDLQDTGESPRDPLSQQVQDAHVQLKFFQRDMNFYTKIYHKIPCGPNGPLIGSSYSNCFS